VAKKAAAPGAPHLVSEMWESVFPSPYVPQSLGPLVSSPLSPRQPLSTHFLLQLADSEATKTLRALQIISALRRTITLTMQRSQKSVLGPIPYP